MAGSANITKAIIEYLLDQGHLVWRFDQRAAHHAFEEPDDDSGTAMLWVFTSKDLGGLICSGITLA